MGRYRRYGGEEYEMWLDEVFHALEDASAPYAFERYNEYDAFDLDPYEDNPLWDCVE